MSQHKAKHLSMITHDDTVATGCSIDCTEKTPAAHNHVRFPRKPDSIVSSDLRTTYGQRHRRPNTRLLLLDSNIPAPLSIYSTECPLNYNGHGAVVATGLLVRGTTWEVYFYTATVRPARLGRPKPTSEHLTRPLLSYHHVKFLRMF